MNSAERLAIEYLEECTQGARPATASYRARLAGEGEVAEFDRILRYALTVESFPSQSVQVGAIFGPYRIEEKLGQGGMGAVYRAVDTRLDRNVAMKVLMPELSDDPGFQQRLAHESRVLARLKHPSIVTIHEAGVTSGVHYLVMDFVPGTPLDDVLERLRASGGAPSSRRLLEAIDQPVPDGREPLVAAGADYWTGVTRVMREIVRAIEAAHAGNVLHRDLKPSNVMLLGGGLPVVLDFGLAGSGDLQTRTTSERLFGSVPYFAPEQVQEMKTGFDERTDIYQLGLVLYELLTGQRAFPQDSWTDALQAIKYGTFPAPRRVVPSVPRELDAICLTATEVDLARRYENAAQLGADLSRVLEGRPPRFARAPTARRLRLFARRHRRSLVAAMFALALGTVGGWRLLSDSPPAVTYRPFRISGSLGRPERNPQHVEDGDFLGLDLTLSATMEVYALSVVGPRAHERAPAFVRPLYPRTKAEVRALLDTNKELPPRLKLELPAGRHEVYFSQVDATTVTGTGWEEGLWVFCARNRHPWLEAWLEALRALERTAGSAGIPFQKAIEALDSRTRGGSIGRSRLDERDRKRLRAALESGKPAGRELWPLDDPQPFEIYLPLQTK